MDKELSCGRIESYNNTISFWNDHQDWLFSISNGGIKFNRERFPKWNEEDFAKRFIEVLENQFNVRFEKK